MSEISILHNPRCSKSRQTLQLLQDRGLDFKVVKYLKAPLTEEQILSIKVKLGVGSVSDFMRIKEQEYKLSGLNSDSSEQELVNAMVKYPKLIERPIVIVADQARIGRPPEAILALFDA